MNSRTPRHFDGTHSSGVKIGDMLPDLLARIEKKTGVPFEAVCREWTFLLGEKMASLTRPISFDQGTLTVIVKSSTLYSLLRTHEKARLLKKLQEKFPVRDILFKIG